MNQTKIYSPIQIALGSFWGGPIAVVYFLHKNYISLNNEELARKTIILGSLFLIALLGILPFLPENFPSIVIPLAYSLTGKQLALNTQLSKEKIQDDENYTFESNWNVFAIGILTLLLFMAFAVAIMFGLESAGIIILE